MLHLPLLPRISSSACHTHDVAIPMAQLDYAGGKLVWAGATRDAVKAMPVFLYAKVRATPIARKDFGHH